MMMLQFQTTQQIQCSATITGVDLTAATATTKTCVIKNAAGDTLESVDLAIPGNGMGTSTMYFTAGETYSVETNVVLTGDGAGTYTGTEAAVTWAAGIAGPHEVAVTLTV